MFFIVRFIIAWIAWLIFADKKRWKELFIVAFFAGFIGHLTDTIMLHYKLWAYLPKGHYKIDKEFIHIMNDIGIYIVVTYLFIQWLPKNKSKGNMILYWLAWTTFTIAIEWLHIKTGHMEHYKWWSLWYSYAADWILFYVFYKYYEIFDLKKLS